MRALHAAGRTGYLTLMAAGIAASLMGGSAAKAAGLDLSKIDLAPEKVGVEGDAADIKAFCGTKPIKVALSDGFGGNSWRKITRREFEDEAAKCPNITEVKYTDAQGNVQKQIADIEALGAQHYDVIVVFPDGGPELIRAMRSATADGSAVVPYQTGLNFPGKRGKDYATYVTTDLQDEGKVLGGWISDQLQGKGNVVFLGGTPGNPIDTALMKGAHSVWDKAPGIKLLEGGPVTTKWDGALAQKAVSGLIAKYPQIDAVMTNAGTEVMGAARAFQAAGRKLPIFAGIDENDQACLWVNSHADNPNFKLAVTSARTWMVRLALRKGVAAVQGISNPEPSIIHLPIVQDSTSTDPAKAVKCDTSLPPDAVLTSHLTSEQLADLFKK